MADPDNMKNLTSVSMVDVAANRNAVKWSRAELVGRVLWSMCSPFFALSPRLCWSWRVTLLRLFGARVGRQVHIFPTVRIAIPWNIDIGDFAAIGDGAILYSLGHIKIGARSTISQYAHLCAGTHDYRAAEFTLIKSPITIGDGVWVCADAFVGPGVQVGAGAIVAARAVVIHDVADRTIVAGNPACPVKTRD